MRYVYSFLMVSWECVLLMAKTPFRNTYSLSASEMTISDSFLACSFIRICRPSYSPLILPLLM